MAKNTQWELGRRERQIMDIVYRLGRASVSQVQAELPDPPSYSAVRAMLGFLEDKGHLRHHQDGLKYVYVPTTDRNKARASALQHLVKTFFA
ncbi:MAG TPA: BlaI/MecI/CopY family transcriptional regulator, partial [Terriglobales bacterium]|nr:BlaI/MecI/CopY family transcriptional regulator [Terriglobales bacterium]